MQTEANPLGVTGSTPLAIWPTQAPDDVASVVKGASAADDLGGACELPLTRRPGIAAAQATLVGTKPVYRIPRIEVQTQRTVVPWVWDGREWSNDLSAVMAGLRAAARDSATTLNYWVGLAAVALALRVVVAFGLFGGVSQQADALGYATQAKTMAAGEWNYPNFEPAGRSIALVPFLWAFGTSEAVIKANSITFDIGCVLMAAVLGHLVLRKRSTARWVGWIAAAYPPMILLSAWSYTSNVALFCVLVFSSLAIVACRSCLKNKFLSLGAWLMSGCALGFAMLTRPSSQTILAFGIVCWIGFMIVRWLRPQLVRFAEHVSWKMIWGSGLVFLLGVLGCVAPVLRHNASLNAGWALCTKNEMNYLVGNNPYTPHYKTWQLGESPANLKPEFQAYLSPFHGKDIPRSAMVTEAIRYICERPDIFLLRTANRLRAYWGFDYVATAEPYKMWMAAAGGKMSMGSKAGVLALFCSEGGGYCLIMCLAIGGLFLFPRCMDGRYAAFLVAITAAYQFPYALTLCNGCYHAPVMGFMLCFAAIAIGEARLGRVGGWPMLLRKKWFWIAIVVFCLIQVEYSCWVLAYHNVA